MGACVSVHHKDSDSDMKFRFPFGSKTGKVVTPSPIKDKPIANGDRPITEAGLKSRWSPSLPVAAACDFGSKDEVFFESQPWLQSDCEDDFFSVNGDFTPSRGNTPVHQGFSAGSPQVSRAVFDNETSSSKTKTYPIEKKKKLGELFEDSLRGNRDVDDEQNISSGNKNEVNRKLQPKGAMLGLLPRAADGASFVARANSACNSERTSSVDYRPEKVKAVKSLQCCLPRILSSRSFRERKKNSSPAHSIG